MMRLLSLPTVLVTITLLFGCVIEAPPIEHDPEPAITCENQECPIGLVCVLEGLDSVAQTDVRHFVCVDLIQTIECNPRNHRACASGMTCLIDEDAPCESSWCSADGSTCTDDCRPIFTCQDNEPPVIVPCDPSQRGGCGADSVCAYDDAATTNACSRYDNCANDGQDCSLIACESIFTCQPHALLEGDQCALEDGLQCQAGLTCLAQEIAYDCPNIAPCSDENTDCEQPELDCGNVFTCQSEPQVDPVFCHPAEPYACAPGSACQLDEALSHCEQYRRCGDEERCGPTECEEVFTCQPFSQPEPESESCDDLRCAEGYVCELRGADGCFGDDLCLPRGPSVLVAVCVGEEGTRCNPEERLDRCAGGLGCMDVAVELELGCNPYDDCGQEQATEFQCAPR